MTDSGSSHLPGTTGGDPVRVSASAVTKRFGSTAALDDFSFEVNQGEFLVLLGPSGCGKTTLLRSIAGLEQPDSGEIQFDGENIMRVPPSERGVAMVFQTFALYPHRTVRGNISYSMRLRKLPSGEIAKSVGAVAQRLSIQHLLDRYPRQLSTGEAQRVALARAMVRNPRCFLFDEPLSNLDAKLRVRMRAELREIHDRRPVTTIYVTHDQEEASLLADRVAVMEEGKLVQLGTPHEIYASPCNVFVAGFVGSPQMNFLTGQWAGEDSGVAVDSCEEFVHLPPGLVERPKGPHVMIGVRPEHLELAVGSASATCADGALLIEGKVSLVQVAEPDIFVHVEAHGQKLIARLSRTAGSRIGDPCRLLADAHNLHFFDGQSGHRLA